MCIRDSVGGGKRQRLFRLRVCHYPKFPRALIARGRRLHRGFEETGDEGVIDREIAELTDAYSGKNRIGYFGSFPFQVFQWIRAGLWRKALAPETASAGTFPTATMISGITFEGSPSAF